MSENKSPIIVSRRSGSVDDPFIDIEEYLTPNLEGKVVLTEIPERVNKVRVYQKEGENWSSLLSEIEEGQNLNSNTYAVSYTNKIVTFSAENANKQFKFVYKGTGLEYVPATMIYTKVEDGEVVETLSEVLYGSKDSLEKIDEAVKQISEVRDEVVTNSRYAKEQGDYAKGQGDSIADSKDRAEQAVIDANDAVKKVNSSIDQLKVVGDYNNTTAYKKNNLVRYNNATYMNIADSTGVLPTDTTKWKIISSDGAQGVKGETGKDGSGFNFVATYSNTQNYVKNDIVEYNGSTYIALKNTLGNVPMRQNEFWNIFTEKGTDGHGSVDSVNGQTGVINITANDLHAVDKSSLGVAGGVAKLDDDGNVVDARGNQVKGAVTSVNGKTGDITISNDYNDLINKPSIPSISLAKYNYQLVAETEGKKDFVIPLETFSKNDFMLVTQNTIVLSENEHYTINERTISLKNGVVANTKINIFIIKNIISDNGSSVSGTIVADKSIPLSKLEVSVARLQDIVTKATGIEVNDDGNYFESTNVNSVLQEIGNAISYQLDQVNDVVNSLGKANGIALLNKDGKVTNADGSIAGGTVTKTDVGLSNVTNDKQATKVEFDTHKNEKASLTAYGHTQLSSATNSESEALAATSKAVKTAMDRADAAFTSANDGKTAVANAVTAKGVTASPTDAFSVLATKIGQISTGKKFATGTLMGSPNDYPEKTYDDKNLNTVYYKSFSVTGLAFKPTIIMIIIDNLLYTSVNTNIPKYGDYHYVSVAGYTVRLSGNASIGNTSFSLPVYFNTTNQNTITWLAFE